MVEIDQMVCLVYLKPSVKAFVFQFPMEKEMEPRDPVSCDPPPPGTYHGDEELLWFYRGSILGIPFGSRDTHTDYLNHKMEYLRIQTDGNVFIKIWQPSEHPYDSDEPKGWTDMSLLGKLVQCRKQGDVMELVVEGCGKFYLRHDAKPSCRVGPWKT